MSGPVAVPVGEVAPAVRSLVAAGYTYRQIGCAAGVSQRTVQNVVNHRVRAVKTGTAAALSGLTFRACLMAAGEHEWVPAVGVTRRLQALAWMGWRTGIVAAATGIAQTTLYRHTFGNHKYATVDVARAVDAFYGMAWSKRPLHRSCWDRVYCPATSQAARSRGWVGPLAWDDIDDPAAVPDTGARDTSLGAGTRVVHMEDLEWLIDSGVTERRNLTERLGVSWSALDHLLRRHDRQDLRARLDVYEVAS